MGSSSPLQSSWGADDMLVNCWLFIRKLISYWISVSKYTTFHCLTNFQIIIFPPFFFYFEALESISMKAEQLEYLWGMTIYLGHIFALVTCDLEYKEFESRKFRASLKATCMCICNI